MKLLKNQYEDISESLSEFGFKEREFTLIKRRGRIRIQLEDEKVFFEFFRRKNVRLTEGQHQWEKIEHYEVNTQLRKTVVPNWNAVISELRAWLKKL